MIYLQNIKNYKSLANVKKNISLHKQFLHTFGDSILNDKVNIGVENAKEVNDALEKK